MPYHGLSYTNWLHRQKAQAGEQTLANRDGHKGVHYDQAKGMWVAVLELEPGPNGQRRRKAIRLKGEQSTEPPKALLKKMRAAQVANDRDEPLPNEVATTGRWLHHWADEIVPNMDVSESTRYDYRWITYKYLVPHLGRYRLTKLGPEHIEKMMNAMRAEGLSPRTIAYTRTVLRLALGVAEARGKIARNPVLSPGRPRSQGPSWTTRSTLARRKRCSTQPRATGSKR
jgi:integrase